LPKICWQSNKVCFGPDFPILRSKSRPSSLNFAGRIIAYIINSIFRKTIASGILVVAKKYNSIYLADSI